MSIVTIDGAIKATRTALRKDANKEPLVVGQVVVEFDMDSGGTEAMRELLAMLDGAVRVQISDVQLSLPTVGAKR